LFSKFLLDLSLTLISSAVLAPASYPIKSFKSATKEEIASYDAKVKEITAKPNVVTPLKILQAIPFASEGRKA
jgi:hypothetical protein